MNIKQQITRTAITFAVLSAAGISVAVAAQLVPQVFAQTVLIAIGSAIFGAALAFFLVRMFALNEK